MYIILLIRFVFYKLRGFIINIKYSMYIKYNQLKVKFLKHALYSINRFECFDDYNI